MVTALFATVSLILAIVQWEKTFDDRGDDGLDTTVVSLVNELIVFVVALNGAGAICIKYYLESVWQNYKSPVAFYKIILNQRKEAGLEVKGKLGDNFKTISGFRWIIRKPQFWLELLCMLCVPLPFKVNGHPMGAHLVRMGSVNWIDYSQ